MYVSELYFFVVFFNENKAEKINLHGQAMAGKEHVLEYVSLLSATTTILRFKIELLAYCIVMQGIFFSSIIFKKAMAASEKEGGTR